MHDSSEENAQTENDALLEKLRAQWRSQYLSDGVDKSAEELCGDRTDLVRLLKLHIVFERASIGELIPGGLSTTTQLSITERLPLAQQGGQGELFFAEDVDMRRVVVVKRIRPDAANNVTLLRKFQRGAKINAQLDHPNIVPVLSSGADPSGSPFVVMRRISGRNLHDVIEAFHQEFKLPNYRSSDFYTLLRLFNAVCQAVDYAHSRRALHLDITTTNIIVGNHGEVYLIDWGSSRRSFSAPNQRSTDETDLPPIVTFDTPEGIEEPSVNPPFMSPEQALRSTLTEATDVYQLGAVFYVILTGQLPFERVSPHSAKFTEFRHHVARGLKRPIDHQLRVPAPLLSILDKAMHIESGKRFNTPRELTTAIEHWMADENVACHQYSWLESLHRYRRRRPAIWNTLLATTGVMVIVACLVSFQLYRHNQALAQSNVELANKTRELETAAQNVATFKAENYELKSQIDSFQRSIKEQAALLKAGTDNGPPHLQAMRLEEALVRSTCRILREPHQTMDGVIEDEARHELRAWIDLEVLIVREFQKQFQFSKADAIAVEALEEIRQKLGSDYKLAAELSAPIELQRASNFLDQGLLSQAWSEVQKASQNFRPVRDTLPQNLSQAFDCRHHEILGYYYSEFGNPWLSLKHQLQAKNLSQTLAVFDHTPQSLIRVATNSRLTAFRYLSIYDFDHLHEGPDCLENAQVETKFALSVLDSVPQAHRNSPEWWECNYYAYLLLADVSRRLKKDIDSNEAKLSANNALKMWQSIHPQAGWPHIQELKTRLNNLFDISQRMDDSQITNSIELLQDAVLKVRTQFPEYWNVQIDILEWVKSKVLMNRLKDQEESLRRAPLIAVQKKLDVVANDMMKISQAGVRSSSLHALMLVVAKAQDNITQLNEEEPAKHMAVQEYLRNQQLKTLHETEPDVSWHVVVGKLREVQAFEFFKRANYVSALDSMKQAQAEYDRANNSEPNNYGWLAALTRAMELASRLEAFESDSNSLVTQEQSEEPDQLAHILALWEKCCSLTSGPLRAKFAQQFDETAERILTAIHREQRSPTEQSPGPYANQFGSTLQMNYRRAIMRDKFVAEWLVSNSPWEPANENAAFMTQATIQIHPEESTIELLELQADLTQYDYLDRWYELYDAILARYRHLRSQRQQNSPTDEQTWLKRLALASLNKPGPKWLRSSRWQKVSLNHARSASVSIQLPSYAHQAWHADNDWVEMRYGHMLQIAMKQNVLPEWLELVNNEFQSAATFKKSQDSQITWVENILLRQLLDECTSQPELTSQFVDMLDTMPPEQLAKLHPSTLNFLATLAWLRGDQELTKRLTPAFDQDISIKLSLAFASLFNHQNESGRWFVSRWADEDPDWHSLLVEFEHRLGNKSAVQKSIETLRAQNTDASQVIGVELRIKFDEVRDQANWISSLRLDEQNANPDDINILLVKQYATAWKDPTKANIEKLERLTKHPQVMFLYWVHELLGDLYQKSGDLVMAREYYARALNDFPETPSSTDSEYARISAKLEPAFR